MEVEFHILDWPVPPAFRALTFAEHQAALAEAQPVPGLLPIGALAGEQVLGFGLARASERGAEVLSLFVAPEWWGHGIGTHLLLELEHGLRRWGCPQVRLAYSTQGGSVPAVERVLQKRKWGVPEPKMVLMELRPDMVRNSPWLQQTQVPEHLELFRWVELTPAERAQVEALQGEVPSTLWPFQDETIMEPDCSLGLRAEGQVVGWMICHRPKPDRMRYTAHFIRPAWRTSQANFGLMAEAARRRDAKYGERLISTLGVTIENRAMLRVIERKFRPHALSWYEMRVAEKALPPWGEGGT